MATGIFASNHESRITNTNTNTNTNTITITITKNATQLG
jgi:hypothetical protein